MIVLLALVLAPLLPGCVQTFKARLQGRRGRSPLQPYRVLRRLWGKSTVDPEGTGMIYRTAPALAAACLACAISLVPVGGHAQDWGLGHDALVLLGLLSLARFALAAAAWDTASGFALMGAARDLMLAVFGEALAVAVLLLAALPAQSTDLVAMTGADAWNEPARWCGVIAFAVLLLAETGRQPIDNPDTHLELTMIHEGPLLEYAGRDLAYLHWATAARHWVFFALGVELLIPHPSATGAHLAVSLAAMAALAVIVAIVETAQAKLRILRVPALLGLGWLVALAGVGAQLGGW